MKITKIKTCIAGPYKVENRFWDSKDFRITWGNILNYRPVLVKVETDEGIYGVGEACEFHVMEVGVMPEAAKMMIDKYLAPAIIGMDPWEINKIRSKMDTTIYGNFTEKTAKAALEMAMYDIMGKATGKRVCELLGGSRREKMYALLAIGMMSPEEMEEYARKIRQDTGIKYIKTKSGGNRWGSDPKLDLAIAKAVRAGAGDDMVVTLDFNQGYLSYSSAIDMLRKCEPYSDYYEQPLQEYDYKGMGQLTKTLGTEIIADESGHWPRGVMCALDEGVRNFNVKPTRQGGIHEALKSIHAIELFGGACSVGGVMESLVSLTAFSHLGSTVREGSLICMEGGDQMFRFADGDTPIKSGGITLNLKEGVIELPKGPGLGLELKDEVMAQFEE